MPTPKRKERLRGAAEFKRFFLPLLLKVAIDANVPAQYSNPPGEPLAAQSTVVLIFAPGGSLTRRLVYSIANATSAPQVLAY